MAELRRILVDPNRINHIRLAHNLLELNDNEVHYIKRVLRLKVGDKISIVDGGGNLWTANIEDKSLLSIDSYQPSYSQKPHRTLIGLAVVLPRRGFDEFVRMASEIGIDFIQVLTSARSTPQAEEKWNRWNVIMNEAIEQSENLWKPKLLKTVNFKDWLFDISYKSESASALATSRYVKGKDLRSWITENIPIYNNLWTVIGPEGGWTEEEESLAKDLNCDRVSLGDSILRTSTAAVVACQILNEARRN